MQHTTIDLFFLLRKQTVTGIVIDGILKLPPECLPPAPLKLKGIQQLLQIEQLNRRLNGEVVQVSEYLQGEGYTGIVLKGQGIARYYPLLKTVDIRSPKTVISVHFSYSLPMAMQIY